jgi:hypothetical protein
MQETSFLIESDAKVLPIAEMGKRKVEYGENGENKHSFFRVIIFLKELLLPSVLALERARLVRLLY